MPKHRGFRAWLNSGDLELEEFEGQQDPQDERVFTCWVPSEVGKRFTIHWKSDSATSLGGAHKGQLIIDGVKLSYGRQFSMELEGSWLGQKIKEKEECPFLFSGIKLTDDDTALLHESISADIGSVILRVWIGNMEKLAYPKKIYYSTPKPLKNLAIHENTKKLGGHRMTLGEAEESPSSGVEMYHFKYADSCPHVIFKFLYRPKEFLQAQGIVPPIVTVPQPLDQAAGKRKSALDESTPGSAKESLDGRSVSSKKIKTEEPSIKIDDTGGNNGQEEIMVEDTLSILERQLAAIQEQVTQLRAQKVKTEPSGSSQANALASGSVTSVIDLTLD